MPYKSYHISQQSDSCNGWQADARYAWAHEWTN